MTVGAGISVSDGKLTVLGSCVLTDVHPNIEVAPATGGALATGAFIGVRSDQIGSRRVFPVGKLEYACFPFDSMAYSCCPALSVFDEHSTRLRSQLMVVDFLLLNIMNRERQAF